MKKKGMKLFALVLAGVMSLCMMTGCGDEGSGNEVATESALSEFTFDETQDPPPTKDVVFVKGSWKEMGIQYGQQATDSVQRSVASGLSGAIEKYGSYDKVVKNLDKYKEVIGERAPELLDLWDGMAEGAGIDPEHMFIASVSYNPQDFFCSTISIWGEKSEDGKLITGTNSDGTSYNSYYTPAVVAFPDEGNAFMGYSGFVTNFMMNEKGLAVMASQGQEGDPANDFGVGIPTCAGAFHLVWSCDSAKEAKNTFQKEKLGPGSGENLHVSDISGDAFVVEHTNAREAVRTDKDLGTGNYTIATNAFFMDEMQESLFKGDDYWDDCLPRYWTEEKIIQDAGVCNIDTIGDALGCNDYYTPADWYESVWEEEQFIGYKDIENGVWTYDNWDKTDYKGFWSPENREPSTKCVMRGLAEVNDLNFYVMSGCRDTNVSAHPDGTGNFWKLTLGKNFKEILSGARNYAKEQLYLAEIDIDEILDEGGDATDRQANLKEAKSLLLQGNAYSDKAGCTSDKNEKFLYMGKAATAYCRAQCYAQLAQDEPSKALRDPVVVY